MRTGGDDGGAEVWEPEAGGLEGTGRVFTDGGGGVVGAEVARYLGVSGSCVTRIVSKRHLSEEVRLRYQVR